MIAAAAAAAVTVNLTSPPRTRPPIRYGGEHTGLLFRSGDPLRVTVRRLLCARRNGNDKKKTSFAKNDRRRRVVVALKWKSTAVCDRRSRSSPFPWNSRSRHVSPCRTVPRPRLHTPYVRRNVIFPARYFAADLRAGQSSSIRSNLYRSGRWRSCRFAANSRELV